LEEAIKVEEPNLPEELVEGSYRAWVRKDGK